MSKRATHRAGAQHERHHGISEPCHTEILSVPIPTRAAKAVGRLTAHRFWAVEPGARLHEPIFGPFFPRSPDAIDFLPLPSSVEPSPLDERKSTQPQHSTRRASNHGKRGAEDGLPFAMAGA